MTMIHRHNGAFAGGELAWPTLRGRNMGARPGFDFSAMGHLHPGGG
jgi:hypothetical protein